MTDIKGKLPLKVPLFLSHRNLSPCICHPLVVILSSGAPGNKSFPFASLQSFRYLMTGNWLALPDLPCSRLNVANSFCLFSVMCSWHLAPSTGSLSSLFFLIPTELILVAVALFLQASHSSCRAQGRRLRSG